MPNDKDKNNSDSQAQQSSSSRPKWTPSSNYHECSDPRSKVSVHSAEANRRIADARSGYASKPWNQGKGDGNSK